MVEIEDGTAVVSVRLSEQITRRLFGVEAREFKKIFQANPERAMAIQVRRYYCCRSVSAISRFLPRIFIPSLYV